MGSKWKKVKIALGLNLCVYTPRTTDEEDEKSLPPSSSVSRFSDAAIMSPEARWSSLPSTPISNKLKLSKSLSKSSSKNTCSICLASMKRGDGQAIFTAECSHSFHFHCITSNVKHGNQICPVCRANWKEIPLQGPTLDPPMVKPRVNPVDLMTVVRRLPPRLNTNRHEPAVFNDDESLDHKLNTSVNTCQSETSVKIKTYTEFPEIQRSESHENFTILINLKAPGSNIDNTGQNLTRITRPPRAPVDLVTVLDISGSMAGTKLALLKRAMGFVIQNLGPNDRLSVISFSSTARRLFPLLRMSESGKQQAILAVNSLVANGGTNIAEGLRKGAKVMEDRREKNPVGSIILLSDGQDTYTVSNLNNSNDSSNVKKNYELLLPLSIREPVHAFGFGADHDALSMHSISEISGGTFSFIETESVIQDAFAQCIGGLLSVVVKGLKVKIESLVHLGELKTGNYKNKVNENGRSGFIDVGDMYADEERDFLISVNIPKEEKNDVYETSLLNVGIVYNDPFSDKMVNLEGEGVKIKRSKTGTGTLRVPVLEVDRQKNRFMAAKAMNDARALAENGSYVNAASVLETCRKLLLETISVKSKDPFCVGLDLELKEMQERMTSRHVYEVSGRAYILSGLSSHSWQRATARGDSTNGTSLVQAYQTPSMTEMVSTSHASSLHTPLLLRPNGRGV